MPSLVPWIDLLGRSLLHFFWQGMLIGLLYSVLRMLCIGVAARYRLGMGALLSMLVCPVGDLCLVALDGPIRVDPPAPSSLPNAPGRRVADRLGQPKHVSIVLAGRRC